jgi:hypothetical protein
MLAAVHFDDQPAIVTDEVENVTADRYLAAKAKSLEPVRAQSVPKLTLGVRHGPSEHLRSVLLPL